MTTSLCCKKTTVLAKPTTGGSQMKQKDSYISVFCRPHNTTGTRPSSLFLSSMRRELKARSSSLKVSLLPVLKDTAQLKQAIMKVLVSGLYFGLKITFTPPAPPPKMIFFPSPGIVFLKLLSALFALILPYFTFISPFSSLFYIYLTLYFPFLFFLYISPFFSSPFHIFSLK